MDNKDNKIEELEKKILLLEDENESLWAMLDEIKKSDKDDWMKLIEKMRNDVITRALMVSKERFDA
tara:strand:+ start:241 stop:438 length:198 start_codon:yes stop_codon:yes gene_type:complete